MRHLPSGGIPPLAVPVFTATVVGLSTLLLLPAAGRPLPRNRPLSPETQQAVSLAVALEARADSAWSALESRFTEGSISASELAELRVRWAATLDERHTRSGATLQLMEAGVDTRTAVLVPQAIEAGDLAALDAALGGAPSLPQEIRLLHVGVLWALSREGHAALVYRDVLGQDSVLAYYDSLLEEWLRGRAEEIASGGEPTFEPSDSDRAEALRQNLRDRGAAGRFLLTTLDPPQLTPIVGVPLASLDRAVVTEVLGSQRVDLFYCYERNGGIDRLGPGTLTLEFGVGPYGAVEFCSVLPGADLRPAEVRDCCCDAVERNRFPAPEGGGRVTVRHPVSYPMKRK